MYHVFDTETSDQFCQFIKPRHVDLSMKLQVLWELKARGCSCLVVHLPRRAFESGSSEVFGAFFQDIGSAAWPASDLDLFRLPL